MAFQNVVNLSKRVLFSTKWGTGTNASSSSQVRKANRQIPQPFSKYTTKTCLLFTELIFFCLSEISERIFPQFCVFFHPWYFCQSDLNINATWIHKKQISLASCHKRSHTRNCKVLKYLTLRIDYFTENFHFKKKK